MPIGPMLASASGLERRARDATPNDNRSLPPSHSSARWPCAECPIRGLSREHGPAPNDRRRREGAAAQPEAEPLPSPRPRPRPRTTRVPSPSPESAIAHVMRHARPFGLRILFLPVSRRPSYLSAKRLNIGSSDGAAYAGMHAHQRESFCVKLRVGASSVVGPCIAEWGWFPAACDRVGATTGGAAHDERRDQRVSLCRGGLAPTASSARCVS
jgi:hypothetical protein